MAAATVERPLRTSVEHPENRAEAVVGLLPTEAKPGPRTVGLGRAILGVGIAGVVGSVLTLMTVAHPLGAGDTIAALCMLPLALMLIAIVNGWIAANLFIDSGPH